jgi:hypothetical protein
MASQQSILCFISGFMAATRVTFFLLAFGDVASCTFWVIRHAQLPAPKEASCGIDAWIQYSQ